MASTSTGNTCLDLHLGIGEHCNESVMHKPSTQSRLLKIKPHMFRKVMSMNECYSQGYSCCRDIHHEARKASESSCNIKMKELFPQHIGFVDSSMSAEDKTNTLCEEDDMPIKQSVDVTKMQPPKDQSKSQLTILYNGAMKVFHVSADKAEVIMMMAAGNTLPQTSAFHGASSATWDGVPLCRSIMKNSSTPAGSLSGPSQITDAELPLARKLSLQRFLHKRKDRVKRQMPYAMFAK